MAKEVPITLVNTWIKLLESSEQKEVKDRALGMIVKKFGNIEAAKDFLQTSKSVGNRKTT